MRLHELPLVCARLTFASDLETLAAIASFVMRARGLLMLVMCQFEGDIEHDDHCGGGGGNGLMVFVTDECLNGKPWQGWTGRVQRSVRALRLAACC
jgi:hypothetical protein